MWFDLFLTARIYSILAIPEGFSCQILYRNQKWQSYYVAFNRNNLKTHELLSS